MLSRLKVVPLLSLNILEVAFSQDVCIYPRSVLKLRIIRLYKDFFFYKAGFPSKIDELRLKFCRS